jgi:homoserine O-acetyltransferase
MAGILEFAGAVRWFKSSEPFVLECGEVLPELVLAYTVLGEPNAKRTNAVWVCHALTGNADITSWWGPMLGREKILNPEQDWIICANMLGSCYGSSGPLAINPETGAPYYGAFPVVTVRDTVRAFDLLREHLGVEKIRIGLGGSLGGQQLLEWAVLRPNLFGFLFPLATNARHSAWGIAFNEAQRMALEADPTLWDATPDAGQNGLKAARAIGMLSYRNYETYEKTQAEPDDTRLTAFRASSYQRYQGDKLVRRFNAQAYYRLTQAMDSHHLGRGRGPIQQVLNGLKTPTLIIGISTDLLFPVQEQEALARALPNGLFTAIDSPYGHDGFLVEFTRMTHLIRQFMKHYE